jgi:hypothetical protein
MGFSSQSSGMDIETIKNQTKSFVTGSYRPAFKKARENQEASAFSAISMHI